MMASNSIHSLASENYEVVKASPTKAKIQGFAEQIKQLELEGNKLLEATYTLSNSVITTAHDESNNVPRVADSCTSTNVTSNTTEQSLSALTDFSAEQKTIEELRMNLDARTRETEQLQRSLAEPLNLVAPLSMSSSLPLGGRSSSLSALNLPVNATYGMQNLGVSDHNLDKSLGHSLTSSYRVPTPTFHTSLSQAHLDRQIKELQDELASLRNRNRQTLTLMDEQKHSFRNTQEELKRQLMAVITTKDNIIEVKSREISVQEEQVSRLRDTVKRLEQDKRLQDQTLIDINHRFENAKQAQYALDNITSQLRKMVADRETRRGRPFSEVEPCTTQSLVTLLHHADRYSTEIEAENEQINILLREVTNELDTLKASSLERQHSASRQHQDRLTELVGNHDQELSLAVERSMQARSVQTILQEQLSVTRQENTVKLAEKDELISELRREVDANKQTHCRERTEWLQKEQVLQAKVDASKNDLKNLMKDQEDVVHQRSTLGGKVDDLQSTIDDLHSSLNQYKTSGEALTVEKEVVGKELNISVQRLEQSEQEVRSLRNLVELSKLQSNAQLQTAVATLEREEKSKAAEQLRSVTEQYSQANERLNELTLQYEVLKADHKNLLQQHGGLEAIHQNTNKKVEEAQSSKETLTTSLQEQLVEISRISQEREYYQQLASQRGTETHELRVEMDKLIVQMEERQTNFCLLKEQHDRINGLLTTNSEMTLALHDERDKLADRLATQISDAEQRVTCIENLTKKLRIREKHLSALQEDNKQMAALLAKNKEDVEQLTNEKDILYRELKDSRYEVSAFKEYIEATNKKLNEAESTFRKDLGIVNNKLKATTNDLRMAKKAINSKEHMDVVRVAGKMQREVTEKRGQIDSLQSKSRWLEECLENIVKEKNVLKYENETLSESLQNLKAQKDSLKAKLGDTATCEKDLHAKISKLEAALEKAAIKYAAAQAQMEQFEQDNARLKLKHQLDLKELVRSKVAPVQQQLTLTKMVPMKSVYAPPQLAYTAQPSFNNATSTAVQEQNHSTQTAESQTTNSFGPELRELMFEMVSMIQGAKHTQPAVSAPQLREYPDIESVNEATVSAPNMYHRQKSCSHLNDLRPTKLRASSRAPERHKPSKHRKQYASSPCHHDKGDSYVLLQTPSTSPVSDLLADSFSFKGAPSIDTISTLTEITDDFEVKPTLPKNPNQRLPANTTALCKRLEKRLEKLSKLGNHLVDENREIGEMMKNQDVQLKKVRSIGKLLKT